MTGAVDGTIADCLVILDSMLDRFMQLGLRMNLIPNH